LFRYVPAREATCLEPTGPRSQFSTRIFRNPSPFGARRNRALCRKLHFLGRDAHEIRFGMRVAQEGCRGRSVTRIFGGTATRIFENVSGRDMEWSSATRLRRDRFAQLRFTGGSPLDRIVYRITAQQSAQRLRHRAAAPTTCEIANRLPEIWLPETRKELSPRPFALVLNVIFIDLKPLSAKRDQDLVPDGGAGFGVTAAELLHHILRNFGRERCLEGTASRWGTVSFIWPARKCIEVHDTDSPLLIRYQGPGIRTGAASAAAERGRGGDERQPRKPRVWRTIPRRNRRRPCRLPDRVRKIH
jgi:hypothetical protein